MAEKMVIVPQRMLDELEQARLRLYAMYPSDINDMDMSTLAKLVDISDPMWKLANTKWEEVK
jgi:hypothetical protein